MSNQKFIAIDCGKHTTKVISFNPNNKVTKELTFRTKMEKTLRTEAQGNSYLVTYDDHTYIVGEQAEETSSKSSKAEELHKICTYVALHQLANTGEELVVCIGCPLSLYENATVRNDYKDYIFPSKQIDIRVGNVSKHLTIRSVIVMPESSGVLYLEPDKFNSCIAGIVDLGGVNINACCYKSGGVPIISTLYTDTLGSAVLTQNLKNALMTKYNIDIPQWMMDDIISTGYIISNKRADGILEGSKEFITEFKRKHVQTIVKKCEANGWSLDILKLVFIGGTSELLRNEIKEILPGATIYPEASMANVRGFLQAIID